MSERRRILPLDKSVVNLIAAGEIIIAPSNALKELLENSIDAKASQIDIIVKDGGLKLLQITDNGTGINKDDLPILCERFTTSKLVEFDDLRKISTYGFRGEALASISHIARLNVITKTEDDACAWKASYKGGELVDGYEKGIKPIAGKQGTVLVVEDLFYNVPSRLRALKSPNEEYSSILDVVNKYSIHVENVGFNCQRQGGSGLDVMVRKQSSRKDRIRTIYGSNIADNLLDVDIPIDDDFKIEFGINSCKGMISNTSFENKKTIQPIFFINNRLVVCDPLRRAINLVYSTYLPKGHKPFIYLALEIAPQNVDVNVHPTKKEVRFLNEVEIIDHIVQGLESQLGELDSSRKFLTQQILTNSRKIEDSVEERRSKRSKLLDDNIQTKEIQKPRPKPVPISQFRKPYEHEMVRTDYSQTTLNNFVKSQQPTRKTSSVSNDSGKESQDDNNVTLFEDECPDRSTIVETTKIVKERKPMTLMSVRTLRKELQDRTNKTLTQILAHHTFVGIADYSRRLCCIQHDVKLYLVDYASLCTELFYEIGLTDFGNFGRIEIVNEGGIDIKELVKTEIYDNPELVAMFLENSDMEQMPDLEDLCQTCFVDMQEMWEEYFSIQIDITDKNHPKLKSLPLLIPGYIPSWNKLSLFLFRVITKVDWEDEKDCLGGILRQLALFYVPETIPDDAERAKERQRSILDLVENLIMPLVKRKFLATDNMIRDVIEIASLPKLYKVFERC